MRKIIGIFIVVLLVTVLAACGEDEKESQDMEPKALHVEFPVPDTTSVEEPVELKAIVTYGDEKVKDADEVKFEYWEKGNEDDSTMVEAKNNDDGTYTAEVTFDHEGEFEMYAHTTARDLHTMPKKSITVK
ncbi:FixH family protein [Lentibacillus sp. Marseille-P4043]|uniref:FixH family protein n=1 Tax=Lentibacillus sp. Marseille-P4043 TaxID=2040293 RepID=UPI000D0B8861|nr:FixH family protein [Lentibacillus sp. Marseille-P4043]